MPPYDTQIDAEALKLVAQLPRLTHALRPQEELQHARDVAELWHWRSRTRYILERPGEFAEFLKEGNLDQIVRLAAEKAAENGDIPAPLHGDFPSRGKPYRELTAEEYSEVTSIASERHRAMNWLTGTARENRWDLVETNT